MKAELDQEQLGLIGDIFYETCSTVVLIARPSILSTVQRATTRPRCPPTISLKVG